MQFPVSIPGIARACAKHPLRTIGLWLLLAAISAVVVSRFLAGVLTTDANFTNTPESKRADQLLAAAFKAQAGPREPNETVVIKSSSLSVNDPVFRDRVASLFGAIMGLGPDVVAGGVSYLSQPAGLVSADQHTTIVPLVLVHPLTDIDALQRVLLAAPPDNRFQVYSAGKGSINKAFSTLSEKDLSAEFRVGLPVALVVLLVVFSALVAALVPVVLGLLSIIIALAIVALIGQAFHFSFFVTNMVATMGLAVGIDYSLFIMSRYREERRRGAEKIEAISAAGASASRAVFFSGATVVLALLGLLIVPTTVFRSLGAGAIIVVVVAVAAALTLLPAVISVLGDRVDALRLPFLGRQRTSVDGQGGFWDKTSRAVMARPWASLAIAGGVLVAAAVPTLGLKIGQAGVSSLPASEDTRKAFDILQAEFSTGTVARADIVVSGDAKDPAVQDGIARLRTVLSRDPDYFADQALFKVNDAGNVALLSVPMVGDPGMKAPQEAIRRLRDKLIPTTFKGLPVEVLVTGAVAGNIDYFDTTNNNTPAVFAFVLTLSFLLLTFVFRSLVVPLKAIVLNLLSVGAAYGLMVLVFLHGVGASLFGFTQTDAIEAWIPLFLFSILFGLSMDYHVFLLSRIRERFDRGDTNEEAVAFGVRTTAGIITGAALIMVAIFAGFASGQLVMFQQVGFGLSVAILLDATIVRSVLVPATMRLLGTRNWYLPKALNWIPAVRPEVSEPPREPSLHS